MTHRGSGGNGSVDASGERHERDEENASHAEAAGTASGRDTPRPRRACRFASADSFSMDDESKEVKDGSSKEKDELVSRSAARRSSCYFCHGPRA